VKRGEELGIRCSMNYMLMQLVKGKRMVVQHEIEEGVPLVKARQGEREVVLREGEASGEEKV
jgi:2-dehydropantoate 2-reductase